MEELRDSFAEALENSHMDSVLVEEFIEGPEYSIESLHYDGKSEVIQFTEKKTTEFPYNVEIGHRQPALLTEEQKDAIRDIVCKIGNALHFENCPSHTELKINNRGVFVIETSPRLGGDYITSTLTPLSTGINMEDQLLHIALGESVSTINGRHEQASGVEFFQFPEGVVKSIDSLTLNHVSKFPGVVKVQLKLKERDMVYKITSSMNRYGEVIAEAADYQELCSLMSSIDNLIKRIVRF